MPPTGEARRIDRPGAVQEAKTRPAFETRRVNKRWHAEIIFRDRGGDQTHVKDAAVQIHFAGHSSQQLDSGLPIYVDSKSLRRAERR